MQADYALEYDVLSMAREHRLHLLVRVNADAAPDYQRQPLNLSVVLDRSSSMIGEKIEYVKDAAEILVQRLGAQDRFSLVTYNDAVQVVLPPTNVIHKDGMRQAIQAVRAFGTTNLSGGWLQGCNQIAEHLDEDTISRVLLLTDGLANRGVTDADRLADLAHQKRDEGIVTTTMGVGMNFNEDLLVAMAEAGGGAFYFIDNADQAPTIFAEELSDLLNVVGQNMEMTLTLSRGVQFVRQLNTYPRAQVGDSAVFQLGDLYADEVKLVLLELMVPAIGASGAIRVGELHFTYDDLSGEGVSHESITLPLTIKLSYDDDVSPTRNDDVARTALLLRAARARELSIQHADAGDFAGAQRILSEMADAIQQHDAMDKELLIQHNMLREEALDMELGAQRYDSYTRKSTATKSYDARRTRTIDETLALHSRLKSSRVALERSDPPPTELAFRQESVDLSDIDSLTIGRSDANTIVIPEDEVSAEHCRIIRINDNLHLEDLGSTNGTFANGGRVTRRFRLSAGDVMTVGSWLFMFRR